MMLKSVPYLVDKAKRNKQPSHLPTQNPDFSRIAVLLNRNARKVNDKLARRFERIVGTENFFYSRSLEDAEDFSRKLVQEGYGTIVCGGGDGTLVRTMNLVQHYIAEANAWRRERHERFDEPQTLLGVPRLAFLPLGTGNGLKNIVGSSDPENDLRRLVGFAQLPTYEIPLIEDGQSGEKFIFGGLGYDSALLNDYNWLKNQTKNPVLKPVMHSVLGYFAAFFVRLLPRLLVEGTKPLDVRIINRGPAYYVDPRRGDRIASIDVGATLYEGPASLLSVGTSSYFGYNFKIFPFAGVMPDMMQLRVTKIGPGRSLANLPAIWQGGYRNADLIFDFLVKDIQIDLKIPYPFQHSGDDQGLRDHLHLKVAEESLKLVDFYRAPSTI